jgi:APA family basic amino acid/polyamine antiporter
MVATTRAFYTIGKRNASKRFDMFKTIDFYTNMPMNSVVIGVIMVGIWYVFFYSTNLTTSWFGKFTFDSSELPIITMYGMYFPIFILMIIKERKVLGHIKGVVLPTLGLICSAFMVFAAIYTHGINTLYYLIVFVVVMLIGSVLLFKPKKTK